MLVLKDQASLLRVVALTVAITAGIAIADGDADQDGIPDNLDSCPTVEYNPGFDWVICDPMDLNPNNDSRPECKARERIAIRLVDPSNGALVTRIAFAVVKNGELHFADAFTYIGGGEYEHDPEGVNRLFRVGSTTKPLVATAAMVLEETGQLALEDFVNDDDATQIMQDGERTLAQLLSHQGAFKLDDSALHLFCYPFGLAAFWLEPDDLISPHYDSETYGHLGGGFQYSAFNYSLAGAYLANRTGQMFHEILQDWVFDSANMCTASFDGSRAVDTPIGGDAAISQGGTMHVGPYINMVSAYDDLCEDNFYSSEDLPGDDYTYQYYHLDEASAEPRDPAGGVIASVIDMAHFAEALFRSYHYSDGLLSQDGVRRLWGMTSDLGCDPDCPYEPYYGVGFFTDTLPDKPVNQVGHGGSRAGYKSAFVIRPESNLAVSILLNADVSTVVLSDLAKTILDDFEAAAAACPEDITGDQTVDVLDLLAILAAWGPCPACDEDITDDGTVDVLDLLGLLAAWGPC